MSNNILTAWPYAIKPNIHPLVNSLMESQIYSKARVSGCGRYGIRVPRPRRSNEFPCAHHSHLERLLEDPRTMVLGEEG